MGEDCVYQRVKAFIEGWDACRDNMLDTYAWIPDDQLVAVIRRQQRRREELLR